MMISYSKKLVNISRYGWFIDFAEHSCIVRRTSRVFVVILTKELTWAILSFIFLSKKDMARNTFSEKEEKQRAMKLET
jgi:hypothetical protein